MRREWVESEIEYLHRHYGLRSDANLARHLQRSVGSIKAKADAERLTRTNSFLTLNAISLILKVSDNRVKKWVTQGVLKGKRSVVRCGKYFVWHIGFEDFEDFLTNHPDLYDPCRIGDDYRYWQNFVKGIVPENTVPKLQRNWTPEEDEFILNHRKTMTYAQLATKVKRTSGAVHQRLQYLKREKGRLVLDKRTGLRYSKRPECRPWTESELFYVQVHYGRARTIEDPPAKFSYITAREIAQKLCRTENAIHHCAEKLRETA